MDKVKISDVCIISNGYAFKSEHYVQNNGVRIIRITNVQKGEIVDNDPKLYPFKLVEKLNNYKIFEGDIMMSLTGNVGRVGKFPKEMLPAYINQRICRIMPKNEKLDKNYLFHFLNSDNFENDAIRNSSGAAQLNLSTKWLSDYEISLPSLSEQKAIAEKLDKAQEIIRYNEKIIAQYDALTQSLFLDMFGDPVKNEKGWELRDFKYILKNIESGWSPVCENTPRSKSIDWAVLKLGAISYGKFNSLENKRYLGIIPSSKLSNEVKKGDLLFVRKNTYDLVGITSYVFEAEDRLLIPDTIFRLVCNHFISNPIFLHFLINNKKMLKIIQSFASGTSGSMPNISKAKLLDIKVYMPPVELQNQFAEHVKVIERQKQIAEESLGQSKALFNSLLKESFKS